MNEQVWCCDEAANHQLPISMAFWIIWIVSAEECSNLMQNLMQIYCPTRSIILNTMATQYTCSLNGIYRPHWLVQWSHHCLWMCIPVHSPWLPGSIISHKQFIILTMAGLFPDRPHHITIWKMGMTSTRNSTEFTGQNGGFWRNIKYMHNLAFVY